MSQQDKQPDSAGSGLPPHSRNSTSISFASNPSQGVSSQSQQVSGTDTQSGPDPKLTYGSSTGGIAHTEQVYPETALRSAESRLTQQAKYLAGSAQEIYDSAGIPSHEDSSMPATARFAIDRAGEGSEDPLVAAQLAADTFGTAQSIAHRLGMLVESNDVGHAEWKREKERVVTCAEQDFHRRALATRLPRAASPSLRPDPALPEQQQQQEQGGRVDIRREFSGKGVNNGRDGSVVHDGEQQQGSGTSLRWSQNQGPIHYCDILGHTTTIGHPITVRKGGSVLHEGELRAASAPATAAASVGNTEAQYASLGKTQAEPMKETVDP